MRNLKWITTIALGLTLAGPAWSIEVGDQLPTDLFKAETGESISNITASKPVTIVNFWATWCAACKIELVEMEQLFQKESRLNYLFISLDSKAETAKGWLKESMPSDFISKRLIVDTDQSSAEALDLQAMPVTLIINASGKVLSVHNGFKAGTSQTADLLANALKLAGISDKGEITH